MQAGSPRIRTPTSARPAPIRAAARRASCGTPAPAPPVADPLRILPLLGGEIRHWCLNSPIGPGFSWATSPRRTLQTAQRGPEGTKDALTPTPPEVPPHVLRPPPLDGRLSHRRCPRDHRTGAGRRDRSHRPESARDLPRGHRGDAPLPAADVLQPG